MSALHKVLVVDDDPVVAKSFTRVLASKGYAVIAAENGEEALKKLSAEKYDLVFTDIKMPGMNGIEVAERVKASQPWLPVVIITGYGTSADQEKAETAGVSGFLNKPLSPEMIEHSARMALAGHMAPAPAAEESAPACEPAAPASESHARNIGLFLAAPFIGLAYVLAAPFVGLGALAWFGGKALMAEVRKVRINVRPILLAVAAPFIGLAFILVLPFAGIGALAWLALGPVVAKIRLTGRTKNVMLAIAAPFIGLAFAIGLPFAGLGVLAWTAAKAMAKR